MAFLLLVAALMILPAVLLAGGSQNRPWHHLVPSRSLLVILVFLATSRVAWGDPIPDTKKLDAEIIKSATKPPIKISEDPEKTEADVEGRKLIDVSDIFGSAISTRGNPQPDWGVLYVLDSIPLGKDGKPQKLTNGDLDDPTKPPTKDMVSDILVFPNKTLTLNFFSDPFPEMFQLAEFTDPEHDKTKIDDVYDPVNFDNLRIRAGVNVKYVPEGFLTDSRTNGTINNNNPLDLRNDGLNGVKVTDVTVFIQPRPDPKNNNLSQGQAYYIFSENPIPEPGTLVLAGLGGLTLLLRRWLVALTAWRR
jgi:hypothetical protein